MSETNYSTGGLVSITRKNARSGWRVIAFVVAVALGVAVVIWIERSTWSQVNQLRGELAAIRTESFYLGVHLRAGVWRLDGRLLRFQLSEDSGERESFQTEARELTELIEKARSSLATAAERELAQTMQTAFENYLQEAAPLLEKGVRGIRRDTAAQLSGEIAAKSQDLLRLCDDMVRAQQVAWRQVLGESQDALANLNRLLRLSVFLLIALLGLIVALIYRALIVPLRSRLSESQAVIERQEKLASLGTLAAGVAHEIRNPLTAIKLRLFSLKNSLPTGVADAEDMEVIGNEINRLERIVKDFLQFARPSEPDLTPVLIGELLQEVCDLLEPPLARQGIRLIIEASDPIRLKADRQQVKQVLINLIQNAAESIGQNGSVVVRARQGMGRLANAQAPAAILEVADTGKGIPPEIGDRLFDPFFSTKEGGTGLGLPIAARIVEKHGGYLQYQTQRNAGTTFSVVLPRLTDHASKDTAH